MLLKVLPRAMSWIGRDIDGLSLLHNEVCRRCLILIHSNEKQQVVGKVREGILKESETREGPTTNLGGISRLVG